MFRVPLLFSGLLVLLLGAGSAARAQVQVGVKGGLNLSTLDGTVNIKTNPRPAYHGGIYVNAHMTKHLAFQPEVLYSAQGVKFSARNGASDAEDNVLRIDVVNVPLLLKVYPTGRHVYLAAGPQLSVLVKAEEELIQSGGAKAVTMDVRKRFKTGDFAAVAAVGVEVSRLTIDVRGIYGISDINNDPQEAAARALAGVGGLHHRLVQVSAGIRLF